MKLKGFRALPFVFGLYLAFIVFPSYYSYKTPLMYCSIRSADLCLIFCEASVDEIMLALFGQDAGEKHDDYVAGIKEYLYHSSEEVQEDMGYMFFSMT